MAGFGSHGSALVLVEDGRAALATVLVLQELGLGVDSAAGVRDALRWLQRAHYDLLVIGGARLASPEVVRLLRGASGGVRILVLPGEGVSASLASAPGLEVLPPPVDVNALMRRCWPATA